MTSAADSYTQELEKYLLSWAQDAHKFGMEIGAEALTDVMNTLLPGGKRLRAKFLSGGWRLGGGTACHQAEIAAGAALELFQLAALVHDDLIDRSDTRRGIPSAHQQFGNLLSESAAKSDTQRLGLAGAVLLGDMLTVAASQVFEDALKVIPSELQAPARSHFQAMMSEVTYGQFLDVSSQFQPFAQDIEAEIAWSWRVLKHKSARYSIEHPLTLGARLAGADEILLTQLSAVGLHLGEAFQLRDDVLGVFGDPAQTGKPAGDDIREGKRTILILETARQCSAEDLTFLTQILGKEDLNPTEVNRAQQLISASGALARVESYIEERLHQALEGLEPYRDREGTQILFDLAQASSHRTQ